MNVPTTEEQIRALAYRLWEEAGSPEGRSVHFWILAQQQLASEPGMGNNTFDHARTGAEGSKPDL